METRTSESLGSLGPGPCTALPLRVTLGISLTLGSVLSFSTCYPRATQMGAGPLRSPLYFPECSQAPEI